MLRRREKVNARTQCKRAVLTSVWKQSVTSGARNGVFPTYLNPAFVKHAFSGRLTHPARKSEAVLNDDLDTTPESLLLTNRCFSCQGTARRSSSVDCRVERYLTREQGRFRGKMGSSSARFCLFLPHVKLGFQSRFESGRKFGQNKRNFFYSLDQDGQEAPVLLMEWREAKQGAEIRGEAQLHRGCPSQLL